MKKETTVIEGFEVLVTSYSAKSEFINEAKTKGIPLVGSYSYIKHPPHGFAGDYHLHVYDGQKEIFAINKNGSTHDGYHGVRIPNKVFQALSSRFGDWDFPEHQVIEGVHYTYIFKSAASLSYRELLNEFDAVNSEIQLYNNLGALIKEAKLDTGANEVTFGERAKELFLAIHSKIDRRS